MVTVIDYKECVSQEGRSFNAILVQGGLSVAISKETGNPYLTANKMLLSTTFNKQVCQSLIGTTLPGDILKVPCPDYVYQNKETGEMVTLSHKCQYVAEEPKREVQNQQQVNPMPFNMNMANAFTGEMAMA